MPATSPTTCRAGIAPTTARVAYTNATIRATTTLECPRENQKPTVVGRLPSCINFLVVLSMAAIWSASNPCRSPKT